MEKPAATSLNRAVDPDSASRFARFIQDIGVSDTILPDYSNKDFYSDIVRGLLKVDKVGRGLVTCLLSVKPAVTVNSLFHQILLVSFLFFSFPFFLIFIFVIVVCKFSTTLAILLFLAFSWA